MKQSNEDGAIETTLIGLIFSLTFSSLVIAFLLVEFYGAGVAGIAAPVNSFPDAQILSSFQNYQTNDISDSVNYKTERSGTWVYVPNVGRVLSGVSVPFGMMSPMILLNGVSPINNEYIVKYAINNSVKGDYAIIVRWSKNPSDVIVYVKSDGFHIPKTMDIFGGEFGFYPYPNANQVENVDIRTEFNENSGVLKFYFNGVLAFTQIGIPQQIIIPFTATYYAGVTSSTDGFTLKNINMGAIDLTDTNIMKSVASFIIVLAKIVVWNVDSQYLPLELNFLFIKTQLFGIIVCAIMIIRGN